jgi:acetyltransferase
MNLVTFARRREVLYETPREIPLKFPLARRTHREQLRTLLASEATTILSESDSKELLDSYGIPVTQPHAAGSADEAVVVARQLGYPVVLKLLSPQITHKTDVGGVILNLDGEDAVRRAYDQMMDTARQRRPEAQISGVTVQPMVAAAHSAELILGAKQDPVFGTVIMVGMGGIAAELFQDRALELPPLNERLARRMLMSLRTWPLLAGYRGRQPLNVERLIEILMRFSYLLADYPEIQECDVNPLLVSADHVVALDARVVVRRPSGQRGGKPFAHLAIRPYPDGLERTVALKDGTPVLLRPIKPEDEPQWRAMLRSCSPETVHARFRYIFKEPTHEMAARFCFIDYDREMALVAEYGADQDRTLIGVGRLVADPDHQTAEYAVLVVDAWQEKGLGTLLTAHCLQIARQWGIQQVIAETTPDNGRMLATFRRANFQFDFRHAEDAVLAMKAL